MSKASQSALTEGLCAKSRRPLATDLRPAFDVRLAGARRGLPVFEVARIMGTSVRMIERHYGTLLQGSGDAIRGKLDAYLEQTVANDAKEAGR